ALVDPSNPPQHGRLELSPDGSFDYVPDPGFTGTDVFGYFASDGYLASAPAFATIRVAAGTPENLFANAPVLLDDNYDVPANRWPGGPLEPTVESNDDGRALLYALDPEGETFWLTPVSEISRDSLAPPSLSRSVSLQLNLTYRTDSTGSLKYIDILGF